MAGELEGLGKNPLYEESEGDVKNKKRNSDERSKDPKRQKTEFKSGRRGGGGVGRETFKHDREIQSDLEDSEKNLKIATDG